MNAVATPTTREVTYPGSSSFLAAPWLVDVIMNVGTSNPAKLIPTVNKAAIKFDATHDNDEAYITKAANQANDFILWAWGIKENKVTSAKLMIDPHGLDLERFCLERHHSCITQMPWTNVPGASRLPHQEQTQVASSHPSSQQSHAKSTPRKSKTTSFQHTSKIWPKKARMQKTE